MGAYILRFDRARVGDLARMPQLLAEQIAHLCFDLRQYE
jgi:hypothetical protein